MERSVVKEIRDVDKLIGKYISDGHDPRKIMNLTQFQIIHYLLKHADEDVCQRDLEIETNLKKASITGAIDSLAEKGIRSVVLSPFHSDAGIQAELRKQDC